MKKLIILIGLLAINIAQANIRQKLVTMLPVCPAERASLALLCASTGALGGSTYMLVKTTNTYERLKRDHGESKDPIMKQLMEQQLEAVGRKKERWALAVTLSGGAMAGSLIFTNPFAAGFILGSL